MEINIGQLVRYKHIKSCVGIVIELGETMAKIRWNDENITEWMPYYALEKINV
jgi:hypothetical protein